MKDSWTCRNYQSGDESQILALYKEVNDREMTPAHWKWKFINNPLGKAVIKLMFDGNKLIGHYAVMPVNVQVGGKLVKAGLSVNTMTHPDYRGHGIFAYLGEEAYRVCQQRGGKFVYGFPNSNIYDSRIKKLDWKGFGKMTALEKDLGLKAAGKTEFRDSIHPVSRFDQSVNSLWRKTKSDYIVAVTRNEKFLNWRFAENPTVEYPKFVFLGRSKGILGFLVLKTYSHAGEVKGHIVDMLCINEKDMVKSFLDYAGDYFTARGITNLSCWAAEGSLYDRVLEQEGFVRKEFETYFGVRIFNREDKRLINVEQMGNWHLMMGDSDVF